jgi:diacylglycerol kinase family enzyme
MTTPDAIGASPPSQTSTRPRLRRIEAVVNVASGGVGPAAAGALAEMVASHGYDLKISTPAPTEIATAVRAAVEAGPDLVIILAGDGTARLAAELCGPDGPLLAPLPGGTMNMLPHALYGTRPWREVLSAALNGGETRDVCGGRVDGHAFYVAAILGAPALWGYAREAVRSGDVREAWRRTSYALRRAFTGEICYSLDGGADQDAEALVLISPIVSKALNHEEALEVAALGVRSAPEAFRLALNGVVGDWRADPGVTVQTCAQGRAKAKRSIPCILDGETQRLRSRIEFEFLPRAFRALVPRANSAARP